MAVRMTKAQARETAKKLGQEQQLGLILDGTPMVKATPAAKLAKRQNKKKKPATDYAEIFIGQMRSVAPELVPVDKHDRKARNEQTIDAATALREYFFVDDRDWRLDIAWPWARVAVEIDGGRWMAGGGRHAGDADKEKRNRLATEGWLVLVYSKDMLMNNPDRTAREIRAALALRGVI